ERTGTVGMVARVAFLARGRARRLRRAMLGAPFRAHDVQDRQRFGKDRIGNVGGDIDGIVVNAVDAADRRQRVRDLRGRGAGALSCGMACSSRTVRRYWSRRRGGTSPAAR